MEMVPVYVFNTPGELTVHLQVTVTSDKCICSRSRIGTPYFPDGWKHQWTLECRDFTTNVTNKRSSVNFYNTNTTTAVSDLELRICRAANNKSQSRINFWLKLKNENGCIDFPSATSLHFSKCTKEVAVGKVIDVTIRVPLDGDFAYLAKKQRKTLSGQHFKKFLSPRCKTDVTVISNDGQSTSAHWDVLAARSSVFNVMLNQDCKETRTNEIQLEMNVETLEAFLTFIYTGLTDFGSVEVGAALLAAGDMYSIEDMKAAAEDFLCESLQADNALDLLLAGEKFRAPELREKAWRLLGPCLTDPSEPYVFLGDLHHVLLDD